MAPEQGRIGFEGRYAYAAVEEPVHGEPVGELSLKGFSRPVAAYYVLWSREDRGAEVGDEVA